MMVIETIKTFQNIQNYLSYVISGCAFFTKTGSLKDWKNGQSKAFNEYSAQLEAVLKNYKALASIASSLTNSLHNKNSDNKEFAQQKLDKTMDEFSFCVFLDEQLRRLNNPKELKTVDTYMQEVQRTYQKLDEFLKEYSER